MEYHISDAYPNPFNPSTTINYSLRETGVVNVTIYDITGRVVSRLVSEQKLPGNHSVVWNGDIHPSGMYFVKLDINGYTQTEKLMLIK